MITSAYPREMSLQDEFLSLILFTPFSRFDSNGVAGNKSCFILRTDSIGDIQCSKILTILQIVKPTQHYVNCWRRHLCRKDCTYSARKYSPTVLQEAQNRLVSISIPNIHFILADVDLPTARANPGSDREWYEWSNGLWWIEVTKSGCWFPIRGNFF